MNPMFNVSSPDVLESYKHLIILYHQGMLGGTEHAIEDNAQGCLSCLLFTRAGSPNAKQGENTMPFPYHPARIPF